MVKYNKGKIVKATVTGVETYGFFVSLDEYYNGLVHISEVSHNFVRDLNHYVTVGDHIFVEILDVDEETHQLKLSIKNINYKKKQPLKKRKIVETNSGFRTLAKMLPYWIEENLKKETNSIDN